MLTGKVINEFNEALQYANIYESDKNGKPLYFNNILKGTTSNKNGLFSLIVNKSIYYITASYSGLEKKTILIVAPNSYVEFVLKNTNLSPVEIVAKKKSNYILIIALLSFIILK